VSCLRALVSAGGYDERVITCLSASLEELPLPDSSIDAVFSHAVVEHLFDLKLSFTQLHRVTRPGGWGLHQVDFRDHRNFDRPLEYLLLEESAFQSLAAVCHLECGNRYRPDETATFIRAAGFEVASFTGDRFTTEEYLSAFLPRLRAAVRSRYHDRPEDELRVISGLYCLRRPGG
jgi:SAM-dependent methyltransferase